MGPWANGELLNEIGKAPNDSSFERLQAVEKVFRTSWFAQSIVLSNDFERFVV